MIVRGFALLTVLVLAGCPTNKNNDNADTTPDSGRDSGAPDTGRPDATGEPDLAEVDMPVDMPDGGGCAYTVDVAENVPTPDRIYTPRWAFEPWISKDISDAADTYAFVDGFQSRDIPVGTVVLDSPWETNYNTFVPNPNRYPDFDQMVADLRDRDVRTVLWVTQMTNQGSFDLETGGDVYDGPAPNFVEGLACGFFINDGEVYTWWKGRGSAVDFHNPVARQWWHEQQDPLYDIGIAGWKLDFGESYIRADTVETFAGEVSFQDYSEAYYKDFYDYGISKRTDEEFVTMVRAYDKSYDFEGRFFARPEHAPVVWVGDNRRDWVGLEDALDHIFRSVEAGYVVVGSDLGGYLNRDDEDLGVTIPFDRTNFLRWLAQSALTPFMQLHGRANLTPWTLPMDDNVDESVALYRYWSHVHSELVPFWFSLAQESYQGSADGIIRPIGELASWAGDYRYMLGDALFVAPILDETGVRDADIPEGTWYDWWDESIITGPTTLTFDYSTDLQRIPLLVKAGAVIPLASDSDVAGFTEGGLGTADVALVWPTTPATQFVIHDTDEATTTILAEDNTTDVRLLVSRSLRTFVARVRFDDPVTAVTVNGTSVTAVSDEAGLLAGAAYRVDGPYVWVSAPASGQATEIIITR